MDSGHSVLCQPHLISDHTVRLLVSVKNAVEAGIALNCGVSILDVKAPQRGPLGRPSNEVLEQVSAIPTVESIDRSVACGELSELIEDGAECPSVPTNFKYFKLGLSDLAKNENWPELWKTQIQRFPGMTPVAVAYADFQQCAAPHPESIMSVGKQLGCQFFLMDTFSKVENKNIFSYVPEPTLTRWIEKAKILGMHTVVAGSIMHKDVKRCVTMAPDYIGVRRAVCSMGRDSNLQRDKLVQLVDHLQQCNQKE